MKMRTIDFTSFSEGTPEERDSVAQGLISGCRELGFVYMKGLPILEPEIVAEAFGWTKRLFDLDEADKMKAPHPPGYAIHRGYLSLGKEKIVDGGTGYIQDEDAEVKSSPPDHKESYDIGSERNATQPNVWLPEDVLPGFKQFMVEYHGKFSASATIVFEALELGLKLDRGFFAGRCSAVENQLRLLQYPSVPAQELETRRKTRFGAHADWSFITLLLQDDCGGLEVEASPGKFIAIEPVPETLVMNVGDVLKRWSNDFMKSSLHQVGSPPKVEGQQITRARYSIPYFVQVDPEVLIECLPAFTDETHPPKYKPVLLKNYLGAKALGKDI